jgi:hypothetical protein
MDKKQDATASPPDTTVHPHQIRIGKHLKVLIGIFTVEGVRGPGGGDFRKVLGGV